MQNNNGIPASPSANLNIATLIDPTYRPVAYQPVAYQHPEALPSLHSPSSSVPKPPNNQNLRQTGMRKAPNAD